MRFIRLAVPALIASAAFADGPTTTTLQFSGSESTQSMREIAMAVGAIADVFSPSDQSVVGRTMTVQGTPERIKLAQWVFNQLDQADPASTAKHEYQFTGSEENLVRIFYIHNAETVRNFQEIATAVRTVADIRRAFTYNVPSALILRGTADQMALAEWLVNQLDQSVSAHPQGSAAYRMTSGFQFNESDVRVFFLAHAATVQDFQEVATSVRYIADIRRVFTYNELRAMVVRSEPQQMQLAEWLINQLDTLNTGQARQASETFSYQAPVKDEGVAVQVFFLNHAGDKFDFQRVAEQVRTTTQARRVFTYNAPRALVVRGSADQIQAAEKFVKNVE
jgi:type II secretory pathway component GspD/PulD (secretin)